METTPQKAHAKFSPSSAKRWLACPGSIRAIASAPPPPESKYAQEGTDAHACLEALAKNPEKLLSTADFLRRQYGEQMVVHAEWALKEINRLRPKGAELLVEEKSDLSFIHPEFWGTADISIVEHFGVLKVLDYKYGAGIAVEVMEDGEANPQLAAYALGIAHKHGYDFEAVELGVIQPRVEHPDGKVRTVSLTVEELMAWANTFRRGIELALKKNAPFKAGDHCRFCPAAVTCPVLSTQSLEQAKVELTPTGLKVPKVTRLKPEEIALTLTALKRLDVWASEVRKHAFHLLERGESLPGWKLVEKRGTRRWADPEAAAQLAAATFGEKAFTKPELLSPAQVEKQVGKKAARFVADHTEMVSSGLTMAQDHDHRPRHDQLALAFPDL